MVGQKGMAFVTILEKLNARIQQANSLVCVGLDSDLTQIPEPFRSSPYPRYAFNRHIIEQTHQYCLAYKPNVAYYEPDGQAGWQELLLTMRYLQENYPYIFTICDAKRADIFHTNQQYARAIFDEMGFDAITLHPYLGKEALTPFLEREDKASIILCRTSNPDATEIQDLPVDGKPLWQWIAQRVANHWNEKQNCMLVMGATHPQELAQVRQLVGDMPLLVPGVGTQGGSIQAVLENGLDSKMRGLIVNASRSVIFAPTPSESAKTLRDQINSFR